MICWYLNVAGLPHDVSPKMAPARPHPFRLAPASSPKAARPISHAANRCWRDWIFRGDRLQSRDEEVGPAIAALSSMSGPDPDAVQLPVLTRIGLGLSGKNLWNLMSSQNVIPLSTCFLLKCMTQWECAMNIFYIIGVVVVIVLVASFLGLHA